MRHLFMIASLMLCITEAKADTRYRASGDTTATIQGTSYGVSICAGVFEPRVIKDETVPGVTALLHLEERDGTMFPTKLVGNIWTRTARVPNERFKGVLDSPGLLHYSKHSRIHLYTPDPDEPGAVAAFEPLGEGKFLVRALMDVKEQRAIPVEFYLHLAEANNRDEDGERIFRFTVRTRASRADKNLTGENVSRRRLNMGGLYWLMDDGVSISVSGHFAPCPENSPEEPGRLPLATPSNPRS